MPVSPAFLPLMHRLVLEFVGSTLPETDLTVGTALGPPQKVPGSTGFEVTSPEGGTSVHRATDEKDLFLGTMTAGVYKVSVIPEGSVVFYAVNAPYEESSEERISEDEIRGLLGDIPVTVVRSEDGGGNVVEGREGWPLAAAAVLFFLLAEVVIASTIDRE